MYRKNVVRQKAAIKEMLKRSRIDLLELPTDKGFTIPVSGFLKGRALGGRV
jgi:hypothetical protein